jgi:beta-aspartyl-peptidase (threonine type)
VTGVRHPISLAKKILYDKNTVYLGAHGAKQFAENEDIELKPDEWFISDHQKEVYEKNQRKQKVASQHGTVGAVAVDIFGNIAAATSTGGLDFCRSGRIADSSMLGVGCYADNNTCAVSCTGEGELIIKIVLGHSIVSEVKYTGLSLSICADHIIHGDNEKLEGDLGAIVINVKGDHAFSFNTERMHRGIQKEGLVEVSIY